MNRYYPTRDAIRQLPTISPPSVAAALAPLDASTEATFNYGGGVKFRMSDTVGLRFDARGLLSDSPDFAFISSDHTLHGFQPTVGITFNFGKEPRDREFERTITITETRVTPAPPPLNSINLNQIQGGGEVCGGTPVNLSVTAATTPANVPLQYQWAVNGTNSGGNQNTFTFTPPEAGGDQRVTVTITDTSQGPTRAPQPVTVTQTIRVRPYVRPTIRVTAAAAEVDSQNATVPLVATVAGDCGGALTTTWTASEGRITPNAQNPNQATFDATSVAFGPASPTDQVKQITITGNVRDTRNQTSAGTSQVSVRRRAQPVQLADILFVRGSARVNNCGQRILTDDVYPQFRSGYSIVLVGHTDASDPRSANLDRDRAYAVGRLLVSGGRSPRNTIDRSNIKVDWVGTDQTAPRNSRQCEASVREAAGNAISASDAAAPNRRVEIWLVPTGAPMPPSVKNPRDLPR
jgi:outer membrane protein OmpA-like peptidoglycan-associated protein